MEQIIFRHENQRHYVCEIIEHTDAYELRAQNIKKQFHSAYFDKNKAALRAVTAQIERAGNPILLRKGFVFQAKIDGKLRHVSTLAQIVYSAIKRNTYIPGRKVMFKDKNPCNLRSSNLYQCTKTTVKTVSLVGKNFLCLNYKLSSGEHKIAITDYNEELLKIMQSVCWYYKKDSRSFYTKVYGYKEHFSLQLIVYICLQKDANFENWIELALQTKKLFHEKRLSIDHKKASSPGLGKYDNRLINLQVLPLALNLQKGRCNRKLPQNCFYVPTLLGAVYGKYDTPNMAILIHRMESIVSQSDIENLKYFCKTGEFARGVIFDTLPISSDESMKIILADLQEAKLYQEAYFL